MANPTATGSIDLLVSVNAIIDKVNLVSKDLDAKVTAAIGKVGDVKINPKAQVELKDLSAEIDKTVANIKKDLSAKLSKVDIGIRVAESLKAELDSANTNVVKGGKVINDSLRTFLKDQLKELDQNTRLDKRQTLVGQLVELEGKNVAEAKLLLDKFLADFNTLGQGISSAGNTIAQEGEKATQKIYEVLNGEGKSFQGVLEATKRDIASLGEALQFVNKANNLQGLSLDTTPTIENVNRLVSVLTKAREELLLFANNQTAMEKAAESFGLTEQQMAEKISYVRIELAKQISTLSELQTAQKAVEKSAAEMTNAEAKVSSTQTASNNALLISNEAVLQVLTKRKAAELALLEVQGKQGADTQGIIEQIRLTEVEIGIVKNLIAEKKTLNSLVGKSNDAEVAAINAEAVGRQTLLKAINSQIAAEEKLNAYGADNAGKIQYLQEQAAAISKIILAEKEWQSVNEKASAAKLATSLAENISRETLLETLKKELTAERNLAAAGGGNQSVVVELESRVKALQTVMATEKELANLNAKAGELSVAALKLEGNSRESLLKVMQEELSVQEKLAVKGTENTGEIVALQERIKVLKEEIASRKELDTLLNRADNAAEKRILAENTTRETLIATLREQLNAERALIGKGEDNTIVLAALESRIKAINEEIRAEKELQSIQSKASDSATKVIEAENISRETLIKTLNTQLNVQRSLLGTEQANPALITEIENRIKLLNDEIKVEREIDNAVRKLGETTMASLKAEEASRDTLIISLNKQLNATRELLRVTPSNDNKALTDQILMLERQVVAVKEAAAEQAKEIKVLNDLRIKYQEATDAASKLVLVQGKSPDIEGFNAAKRAIDAYSKALENAKSIRISNEDARAELEEMTHSWEREAEAVRTAIKVTEQFNKLASSQSREKTSDGNSRAVLTELREQLKIHQEIINVLGQEGRSLSSLEIHQLAVARVGRTETMERVNLLQREVAEVNRLGESYTSLSSAFRSFIRYAVEMQAFYSAMQGITGVAKSVVDLEDSLKSVQAVARATDSEMEGVAAAVKEVAISTEYSTNQIAEAAQTLAQAGVEIKDMGEALKATAELASATGSSLSSAADVLTTVHNVFKELTFKDISDQLTATVNLSKLTLDGLSTILSRAVEVSDTFKISFAQMNAAFAVLKNAGIKDSTISTGYRQALLELFSPDEKTIKFLEKRYRELGQNLSGETIAAMFQGFSKAEDPIKAVTDELNKLGFATSAAAESSRVFDVRATNVLNVLVKQQGEYSRLVTQIETSGAAAKGSATQLEALGRSWDNLGSIITAVSANAFGTALTDIEKLVDGLADLIEKLGEANNSMKELSGSGGTASASLSGIFAGVSKGLSSGSALKGVGTGIGVGAIVSLAESFLTELVGEVDKTAAEYFSRTLQALTVVLTGSALLTTAVNAVKAAAAAETATAIAALSTGAATTSAAVTGGFAMALVAKFERIKEMAMAIPAVAAVSPYGKAIAIAVTTALAAWAVFDKDIEKQIEAHTHNLEEINKELTKANDDKKEGNRNLEQLTGLKTKLTDLNDSTQSFFERNIKGVEWNADKVTAALNEFKGVSTDLGGSQLVDKLKEVVKAVGGFLNDGFNLNELIEKINTNNSLVSSIEGKRAAMYQTLIEAYEASEKTDDQKQAISTFEKLTAKQQSYFINEITSNKEAMDFLGTAKPFAEEMGKIYKDTKELEAKKVAEERAKIDSEIELAMESSQGYSVLYAKVLQAGKDGNIEILDLYKEQISKAVDQARDDNSSISEHVVRSLSGLAVSVTTAIDGMFESMMESIKSWTSPATTSGALNLSNSEGILKLIDQVKVAAIDNSISKMAEGTAQLANEISVSNDAIRAAATPEQIAKFGLAQSNTTQQQESIAETLAKLNEDWQTVYGNATKTGLTTKEIVAYLEKQAALHGELPPVIQNILDSSKKKLDEENASLNKAADLNKTSEEILRLKKDENEKSIQLNNAYKANKDKIDEIQELLNSNKLTLGERADKLFELRKLENEQVDITKAINQSNKTNEDLTKQGNVLQEGIKTALANTQESAEKHAETEKQINKKYEEIKAKTEIYAQSVSELEATKKKAVDSGNAQLVLDTDINKKIYDAKVAEQEGIRSHAKRSLQEMTTNEEILKKLNGSYEEIINFFKGEAGKAFLDQYKDAATHVQKLSEANQKVIEASLAYAKSLDEARAEIAKQVAEKDKEVSSNAAAAKAAVADAGGKNPANDAKEQTRIVLEEITKRVTLHKEAVDKILAEEKRITEGLRQEGASEVELTRNTVATQIKEFESLKGFHTEMMNKALEEYRARNQAVKALDEELKNAKRSDAEFDRQLNQGYMTDVQKMYDNQKNAVTDAMNAIKQIKEGEYKDGKALLDKAIADQQQVTLAAQKAEQDGTAAIGAYAQAYGTLRDMTNQRNAAIEEQRKVQADAAREAKSAADEQITALKSLTTTIEQLNKTLSQMNKLDIGDTTKPKADLEDLGKSVDDVKGKLGQISEDSNQAASGLGKVSKEASATKVSLDEAGVAAGGFVKAVLTIDGDGGGFVKISQGLDGIVASAAPMKDVSEEFTRFSNALANGADKAEAIAAAQGNVKTALDGLPGVLKDVSGEVTSYSDASAAASGQAKVWTEHLSEADAAIRSQSQAILEADERFRTGTQTIGDMIAIQKAMSENAAGVTSSISAISDSLKALGEIVAKPSIEANDQLAKDEIDSIKKQLVNLESLVTTFKVSANDGEAKAALENVKIALKNLDEQVSKPKAELDKTKVEDGIRAVNDALKALNDVKGTPKAELNQDAIDPAIKSVTDKVSGLGEVVGKPKAELNQDSVDPAVKSVADKVTGLDSVTGRPTVDVQSGNTDSKVGEVKGQVEGLNQVKGSPEIDATISSAHDKIDQISKEVNNIKQEHPAEISAHEAADFQSKLESLHTAIDNVKQSNPDGAVVKIVVQQALDAARNVQNELAKIVDKNSAITTSGTGQALSELQNIINALAQITDKTVNVTINKTVTGDTGYSTGGHVVGEGTGTSDSIPVMLSNGEFVIPAKAVQEVGIPFLERVRRGERPKGYATGGLVTDNNFGSYSYDFQKKTITSLIDGNQYSYAPFHALQGQEYQAAGFNANGSNIDTPLGMLHKNPYADEINSMVQHNTEILHQNQLIEDKVEAAKRDALSVIQNAGASAKDKLTAATNYQAAVEHTNLQPKELLDPPGYTVGLPTFTDKASNLQIMSENLLAKFNQEKKQAQAWLEQFRRESAAEDAAAAQKEKQGTGTTQKLADGGMVAGMTSQDSLPFRLNSTLGVGNPTNKDQMAFNKSIGAPDLTKFNLDTTPTDYKEAFQNAGVTGKPTSEEMARYQQGLIDTSGAAELLGKLQSVTSNTDLPVITAILQDAQRVVGSLDSTSPIVISLKEIIPKVISLLDSKELPATLTELEKAQTKAEITTLKSRLGFSDGGHVQGAGTGTSDSIPALLSHGEFVIPAKAVQEVGLPFLERVRKGDKPRGYAEGGFVSVSPLSQQFLEAIANNRDIQKVDFDGRNVTSLTINSIGQSPTNNRNFSTIVRQLNTLKETGRVESITEAFVNDAKAGFGFTSVTQEPSGKITSYSKSIGEPISSTFSVMVEKASAYISGNNLGTTTPALTRSDVKLNTKGEVISYRDDATGQIVQPLADKYAHFDGNYLPKGSEPKEQNHPGQRLGMGFDSYSLFQKSNIPQATDSIRQRLGLGFAEGGKAVGEGTGTSDSIPVMLSNGEFVIPAKAVQEVGLPFLERVRKGERPKGYADGGPVGIDSLGTYKTDANGIKVYQAQPASNGYTPVSNVQSEINTSQQDYLQSIKDSVTKQNEVSVEVDKTAALSAQVEAANGNYLAVVTESAKAKQNDYKRQIASAQADGNYLQATELSKQAALQNSLDLTEINKTEVSHSNQVSSEEGKIADMKAQLAAAEGDTLAVTKRAAQAKQEEYDRQIKTAQAEGNSTLASQLQKEKSIQTQLDSIEINKAVTAKQAEVQSYVSKEKDMAAQLAAAQGDSTAVVKRTLEAHQEEYDAQIKAAQAEGNYAKAQSLSNEKKIQTQLDSIEISKAEVARQNELSANKSKLLDMEAQLAAAQGDSTASAKRSAAAHQEEAQRQIAAARATGNYAEAQSIAAQSAVQASMDAIEIRKASVSAENETVAQEVAVMGLQAQIAAATGDVLQSVELNAKAKQMSLDSEIKMAQADGKTGLAASLAKQKDLQATLDKIDLNKTSVNLENEINSEQSKIADLEAQLAAAQGDSVAAAERSAKGRQEEYDRQIKAAQAEGKALLASQLATEKGLQSQIDGIEVAKTILSKKLEERANQSKVLDMQAQLAAAQGDELAISKRSVAAHQEEYDRQIEQANADGKSALAASLAQQKTIQTSLDNIDVAKAILAKKQEEAANLSKEKDMQAQLKGLKGDQIAVTKREIEARQEEFDRQIEQAKADGKLTLADSLTRQKGLQADLDVYALKQKQKEILYAQQDAESGRLDLLAQLQTLQGVTNASELRAAKAKQEAYDRQIQDAQDAGNRSLVATLLADKALQGQIDLLQTQKAKEDSLLNAKQKEGELQDQLNTLKGNTLAVEKRAAEVRLQEMDKEIVAARKAGQGAAARQLVANKTLQIELDTLRTKQAEADALKSAEDRRLDLEAQLAELNGDKLATARRQQQVQHEAVDKEIKAALANGQKGVADQLTKARDLQDAIAVKQMQNNQGNSSSFMGFADGGLIQGAGTGTSDSIPAMVSNGEYIIPAATVKKLGTGFLDNLPRFASGGLAGYVHPSSSIGDSITNLLKGVASSNIADSSTTKKEVVVVKFEDTNDAVEATFPNKFDANAFINILKTHKNIANGA